MEENYNIDFRTCVNGDFSNTEGKNTFAGGAYSHAEGYDTISFKSGCHTEGYGTRANNNNEHAEGKYNMSHHGEHECMQTLHSVGMGKSDNFRQNALEIMQNGDIYIHGVGHYNDVGTSIGYANTLQEIINRHEHLLHVLNDRIEKLQGEICELEEKQDE